MEEKLKMEILELLKNAENSDSFELGNSKTGTVKIYCNLNTAEGIKNAEEKLRTAVLMLKNANDAVHGISKE